MYFELDYTYNVQRLYMRNLIWEKSERIKRNTLIDQGKYQTTVYQLFNLEANFIPRKQRGFRECCLYKINNINAKYVLQISNKNIGEIDTCRIGKIGNLTNKS